MMRVLIIGKDSYIGNHIDEWLTNYGWIVEQLDVLSDVWKAFDYSSYDTIVHVAGIVHRPRCNDWSLYKTVNTDMPISIATMAKAQGVKQFVFLSSMAVYGIEKKLSINVIDQSTPLNAESMYGKSKLMAEQGLEKLGSLSFKVVIVRPPSVYGKGCKGNYIKGFTKIARRLPVYPVVYEDIKQSMIYIDNLCELIYLSILRKQDGVFCPQDEYPVNAIEVLDAIAYSLGLSRYHSRLLGLGVKLFSFLSIVRKGYGGIEYSNELSNCCDGDYRVVNFKDGIKRTLS